MNEGNKNSLRIGGEIILQYLERFPDAAALTLAKKICAENIGLFNSVEYARSRIRYYLGQSGKYARHKLATNKFVREARKTNSYGLPESNMDIWSPVHIPSIYNKGLIFSDSHFPYQDNVAITSMIDYTVGHKKINFIIINGDGIDCYQGSKFMRDPRKWTINQELWAWVEFLNILQDTFPGVKIYWKLGNHEERIENYLMVQAPALLDMSEFRMSEILKIRGIQDVEVIEHQIIYAGRLPIVHSHEFVNKSTSQVNPARGLFVKSLSSVLGAHSHVSSSHSETDINGKLMSTFSIGCLCGLHPRYALINRWNQGFATIETEGQEFSLENFKIYNGKVYRA
jgi:hypothetical protein